MPYGLGSNFQEKDFENTKIRIQKIPRQLPLDISRYKTWERGCSVNGFHTPFVACEGGHCDFSPRSELGTLKILQTLSTKIWSC